MALMWLPSLVLLALLLMPEVTQAQARNIYCCEDEQGQSLCGDVLPVACYGRAYREISPRGSVIRHVAAPLTAEESAKLEAENRTRARAEALVRQQRRFDLALLDTYRSLDDIDEREERAIEDVDRILVDVRERRRQLIAEHHELSLEVASHRELEVPESLRSRVQMVESELSSYQRSIVAREAEKEEIRARYAADRRRYAELIASDISRRR